METLTKARRYLFITLSVLNTLLFLYIGLLVACAYVNSKIDSMKTDMCSAVSGCLSVKTDLISTQHGFPNIKYTMKVRADKDADAMVIIDAARLAADKVIVGSGYSVRLFSEPSQNIEVDVEKSVPDMAHTSHKNKRGHKHD